MEERQSRLSSTVWRRFRPYLCVRLIIQNSMFSNFCHVLKNESFMNGLRIAFRESFSDKLQTSYKSGNAE